jgi:hypothetical protein
MNGVAVRTYLDPDGTDGLARVPQPATRGERRLCSVELLTYVSV